MPGEARDLSGGRLPPILAEALPTGRAAAARAAAASAPGRAGRGAIVAGGSPRGENRDPAMGRRSAVGTRGFVVGAPEGAEQLEVVATDGAVILVDRHFRPPVDASRIGPTGQPWTGTPRCHPSAALGARERRVPRREAPIPVGRMAAHRMATMGVKTSPAGGSALSASLADDSAESSADPRTTIAPPTGSARLQHPGGARSG